MRAQAADADIVAVVSPRLLYPDAQRILARSLFATDAIHPVSALGAYAALIRGRGLLPEADVHFGCSTVLALYADAIPEAFLCLREILQSQLFQVHCSEPTYLLQRFFGAPQRALVFALAGPYVNPFHPSIPLAGLMLSPAVFL